MAINLSDLKQHIKPEEGSFSLVEKIKYLFKSETKTAETYTLTKLSSKIEKKLINLYTANDENSKLTVIDLLGTSLVKINEVPIGNAEAISFLNNLEHKEVELLFYNLRVFNYGNKVLYPYACKGEVPIRNEKNRIERDEEGYPVMKRCDHLNKVEVILDSSYEDIKKKEDKPVIVSLKDYINIDIDVDIYMQKIYGKEKDSKLYRNISKKSKDKYGHYLDIISMIEKIEITSDDDVDEITITIDDFFDSKGVFSMDTKKVKEFRDFYDNILTVALIREIKNSSSKIKNKNSYIDISFEHKCKSCGFTNEQSVEVYHPSFLLPTSEI